MSVANVQISGRRIDAYSRNNILINDNDDPNRDNSAFILFPSRAKTLANTMTTTPQNKKQKPSTSTSKVGKENRSIDAPKYENIPHSSRPLVVQHDPTRIKRAIEWLAESKNKVRS
jgi:hypothetical protein